MDECVHADRRSPSRAIHYMIIALYRSNARRSKNGVSRYRQLFRLRCIARRKCCTRNCVSWVGKVLRRRTVRRPTYLGKLCAVINSARSNYGIFARRTRKGLTSNSFAPWSERQERERSSRCRDKASPPDILYFVTFRAKISFGFGL